MEQPAEQAAPRPAGDVSNRPGTALDAVTIGEVPVPRRLGTAESVPFEKAIEFAGTIEEGVWGNRDTWLGPDTSLPEFRPGAFTRRVPLAAWRGEEVVGLAIVRYELGEAARTAFVWAASAPALRGMGLGSRLLEAAEGLARSAGRTTLNSSSDHALASLRGLDPALPRLAASTGAAVIPESDQSARFAMAHGYTLAQLERVSVFDLAHGEHGLPAVQEVLARAVQHVATRYELLVWASQTPDEYAASYAEANGAMTKEAPAADLVVEPETWTEERLREREREAAEGGMGLLRAAVLDRRDDSIAAYTELELPAEHPRLAYQADTLVLPAHRGHGLGLLMKAANMVSLAEVAPLRRRIYTWNADENEHMLRINRRLGFELLGYSAAWQKTESG